MASIKVVLFTSKTLKNGEHPIMLRVIKDRKIKYISTGKSCYPNLWDSKTNLPKKKHPLFTELVVYIDKKKIEANKLVLNLESSDKDFSADEIQGRLKTRINKKTVFTYFDEVVERLEKANRVGYANVFYATKNSLKTFRGGKDFVFTDINHTFITRFEEDALSRGVVLNSVFVYLRTFKTLINYARKEHIVPEGFNPFKDVSFTKFRRIKTKKRAISKEQIKAIETLRLEEESSAFHSRNYFLFSFYNRGINFIDLAYLTWENVRNGRLEYTRRKTNEAFNIALLEPAVKILDYYKANGNGSQYLFPILHEKYSTPRSLDNRLDRVLKIVNRDLRTEIGPAAKIDEKLTTYVARHSYATILKRSGVSTSIISEALGHDSEKTTQIYLDSFENRVLDEASRAIL